MTKQMTQLALVVLVLIVYGLVAGVSTYAALKLLDWALQKLSKDD